MYTALVLTLLSSPTPTNLEQCYLNVAMKKTSADMAYIAREICDSVFKPPRRNLVILSNEDSTCQEWWLDRHGRYDSATVYCAFDNRGPSRWELACQYKNRDAHYGVVQLQEHDDAYEPLGEPLGTVPGRVFKTLGACLRQRARS